MVPPSCYNSVCPFYNGIVKRGENKAKSRRIVDDMKGLP